MHAVRNTLLAALLALAAVPSHSAILITEVAPWSSGNGPVGADWFELTNTGTIAETITGWKVDDNSNSSGAAVALLGITSIAPGESVIFLESSSPTTVAATFKNAWFGSNPPPRLQIGTYTGSGVGLSTDGDAVNIYNGSNVLQAACVRRLRYYGAISDLRQRRRPDFAAEKGTIYLIAEQVQNGASMPIGSQLIVLRPVPEPTTVALTLVGLGLLGAAVRNRRRR